MFAGIELLSMGAFFVVALATWAGAYVLFLRAYGDDAISIARLRGLAHEGEPPAVTGWKPWLRAALPRLGALILPHGPERLARLRGQLVMAGLYQANAAQVYLGTKLAVTAALVLTAALAPYVCGFVSLEWALLASIGASATGVIGSSLWLDWRVRRRQNEVRRGLPDFLDVLVLCLEGGLSLTAAMPRVIGEMLQVHPILGEELTITEQTANLGLSVGEAFKQLGERCGLTEVKDLASVVLQSERFGASLAKTLRTHADVYRVERQMHAEEMAQKAAVKILFPMLLFIFPAIFVVLLGPAAYQIAQMFAK